MFLFSFMADGLDRPIKDLSIDQRRFIAPMLNDKDSYGKQSVIRISERMHSRFMKSGEEGLITSAEDAIYIGTFEGLTCMLHTKIVKL